MFNLEVRYVWDTLVDTLWQCLTSFDRSKEINLSRGQSLSGKNIYRLEKSHFKMESFAISSFAIIEEITSASEAEKDSPFVVKTSQCFALTYFCWPSKLTKFLLTTSSPFLGLLILVTPLWLRLNYYTPKMWGHR